MIIKRRRTGGSKFNPEADGARVLMKPSKTWLLKHDIQNATIVDVVVDPSIAKSLRPHQVE